MAIVNGQRHASLQPTRYGLSDAGGYFVWTYMGTRQEIEALVPGIELSGALYEVRQSPTGAADVIEARFAANPNSNQAEAPVNTWEFFAAVIEKDVLEADNPAVNSISTGNKRRIRDALQNNLPEDVDPAF